MTALVTALMMQPSRVARAADDVETPPRAPFILLSGPAREIPTTTSASRDAPVSQLAYGPRVRGDLAGDFALFSLLGSDLAFRFGMRGMIEIEHQDNGLRGPPVPGLGKGPMLWRGLYGLSFALSFESLGRKLGDRGAFEATAVVGHESDHITETSRPESLPGTIEDGGGGNFVGGDVAMRFSLVTHLELVLRVQDRQYIAGPIRNAPGLDAQLRWRLVPEVHPVLALFFEELFVDHGRNQARDGHLLVALLGVAFPGKQGEVTLFSDVEQGNGKGLLIDHRETRFALGVRYAPF